MRSRIWALSMVSILVSIPGISWSAAAQDFGEVRGGYQQGGYPQDNDRYREAFWQGMKQGEWDARQDRRPSPRPDRWEGDRAKRAFEAGYDRGYDRALSENSAFTPRSNEAYQSGLRVGDWAARHNRRFNPSPGPWGGDEHERRAFIAGYNRGYHDVQATNIGGLEIFLGGIFGGRGGIGGPEPENRHPAEGYNQQYGRPEGLQNPQNGYNQQNMQGGNNQGIRDSLTIQGNNVTWQSRERGARVFVQEDNQPEHIFASGSSGTQGAPWIAPGHQYVFVLRDQNGNELARSQVDRRR